MVVAHVDDATSTAGAAGSPRRSPAPTSAWSARRTSWPTARTRPSAELARAGRAGDHPTRPRRRARGAPRPLGHRRPAAHRRVPSRLADRRAGDVAVVAPALLGAGQHGSSPRPRSPWPSSLGRAPPDAGRARPSSAARRGGRAVPGCSPRCWRCGSARAVRRARRRRRRRRRATTSWRSSAASTRIIDAHTPGWLAERARPTDLVVVPGGRNGALATARSPSRRR